MILKMLICVFMGICIFQAAYYPFLMSPDIEILWWQIGILAGIGYIFALPIFLLVEFLPSQYQFAFWPLALVWLGLLYWVLGNIVSFYHRLKSTNA